MAAASAHAHSDENAQVIAVNVIEVPRQTSLSQDLAFEEERAKCQQKLLDHIRDIASGLEIGLRTRTLVGGEAEAFEITVAETAPIVGKTLRERLR